MGKRFAAIWFHHLKTDWLTLRRPELKELTFVIAANERGRKTIVASSANAEKHGIYPNMPVADAKAMVPDLLVVDDIVGLAERLLKALGKWSIRYTPFVALDNPDGLIFDISGCAHLWGGETKYLAEIVNRFKSSGYNVRASIADTIGTAWAVSRYGKGSFIIPNGEQASALLTLPPQALRLDPSIIQRFQKLGFYQIKSFISMPRSVLRRRFGDNTILKLAQALGQEGEYLQPIFVPEPFHERLPCLEPIRTATGIEIAIKQLLSSLCARLQKEGKGIRTAVLKCYRIDGKIIQTEIGTNKATYQTGHLFKLFELKISSIEPALGIELFVLEAIKTEEVSTEQEVLWATKAGLDDEKLIELLDRIEGKIGRDIVHRYLPAEHYWPERSTKLACTLQDKPTTVWPNDRPRPVKLLKQPEFIEVTAPIPDYPPMMFRYKGIQHTIVKADGPERIESEWWLDEGEHRDYYNVEDENGKRYWLFRLGYMDVGKRQWYIHGFFA